MNTATDTSHTFADVGLVTRIRTLISGLTYDGRATILATLVAMHAVENVDPDVSACEEARSIASHACEIIGPNDAEDAGGNHAARS